MPNAYAKTSQQLTMPEHFYRPRGTSNIWVRLVPPRRVQAVLPQPEFRKSTGHSVLARALPVGYALIAGKMQEWDTLVRSVGADVSRAAPTVLTQDLIERICAARLYAWMTSDDEDRAAPQGLSVEDLAEIEAFCLQSDTAMRSVLARGAASPHWNSVIETVLDWGETLGYGLEVADPQFVKLVRAFAGVEKEAQRLIALRNAGEDTGTPPLPAQRGHVLSDVTRPFLDYKSPKAGKKHVGTMLHAWGLLIEHCGDIPLNSVTPAKIFDFMQARLHAKSKPWSEGRAKTFGRRTLSEMFGFARTTGLMSAGNPVEALEAFPSLTAAEEAKRKNPRFPYSTEQLNALLQSDWFEPHNKTIFKGKMREDLGARYWVPLIGIFHGTRVREALQLIAADFGLEGNVYVMNIRTDLVAQDEAEGKAPSGDQHSADSLSELRSVKTSSTRRRVPVHPTLLELGFADFIATRRDAEGSAALLFPSSLPRPGGVTPKLGRSYEQAFLRFVRDRLKLGSGLGNHGLRHQLEDRIREAQARNGVWPAGLGQQYTGRKRTRTLDMHVLLEEGSEADYGSGYRPESMLPYVRQIDFSGLQLPPAFAIWRAMGPVQQSTARQT